MRYQADYALQHIFRCFVVRTNVFFNLIFKHLLLSNTHNDNAY
jgi:hypothetical protein